MNRGGRGKGGSANRQMMLSRPQDLPDRLQNQAEFGLSRAGRAEAGMRRAGR
jgi:hypothetical protein